MAEDKKDKKTKRPTAKKRDLQNEKKRMTNRAFHSSLKTAVRSFEKDLAEKKTEEAKSRLPSLYSLLDKAVKRGIFKLNKASRAKSNLSNRI